jgi:glyoxylase-like metal-dependent hydrolase (beta-lactamase superfamily II)
MHWQLISDGEGGLPLDVLFGGAADAARRPAGDRLGADGRIALPYGCLLIRTDDAVVLVDAGLGPHDHPMGGRGGELEAALAAAAVAPPDVDVVVITHGHLDHIGGLCADGRPRFASARHLMTRIERDWLAEEHTAMAEEQLPPIEAAGLLELVDAGAEPVPGVRLLAAPGHTPGQVAVELGGSALYLADAIIDVLHAEHPDWPMTFDVDGARAAETRRALLGRAADEGLVVAAAHIRTPGTVERERDGFRFTG